MQKNITELQKQIEKLLTSSEKNENDLKKQKEITKNYRSKYEETENKSQDIVQQLLYGDGQRDELIDKLHKQIGEQNKTIEELNEKLRSTKEENHNAKQHTIEQWIFECGDFAVNDLKSED